MPRPPSDDPLVPLPVRLPSSLVEDLRARAAAAGVTVSDQLRQHLTLAEAKPLGKPVPRRRAPRLASVSGADPALLRQLAAIGSNVNQLARAVNGAQLALTSPQLLSALLAIERSLDDLAKER